VDLRNQIASLQRSLGFARDADAAADVQIETLGAQLNAALARVAAEQTARADMEAAERERLERSASEFFGTVREVFEGREGVELVGDRFVFSSEVLFEAGSARLSAEGRRQIGSIAQSVREVAVAIPDGIDWVLRVDGHTDDRPVSGGGAFEDNWELSQARALSVVRYLSEDLGLPPSRLSANGFGQHHPLASNDTAEGRARNRRIELKFTER
jgi:chemotaxis protein MotB